MPSPMIAYCGLYCGACSFRLAAQEHDRSHLAAMPSCYDAWKNAPLEPCPGCRLENACGPCAIRDCAVSEGVGSCAECGRFPCEGLEGFAADGKPHHAESIENLRLLREIGEEAWLSVMAERWTCVRCGKKKSWYRTVCDCPQGPSRGAAS
jgi:hypothetical protein